ncbi:hypothetical protein PVAP13_2NG296303 [Panicum virgatum]|uniref:Uncharacterized protein n=1 Tax=Panicum virgatum TaxID=38727 RepID=A0A8T0VBL7_PANVG|nr:hypothetical protein PVAP13_2NG296303 [Panicum virgatum]
MPRGAMVMNICKPPLNFFIFSHLLFSPSLPLSLSNLSPAHLPELAAATPLLPIPGRGGQQAVRQRAWRGGPCAAAPVRLSTIAGRPNLHCHRQRPSIPPPGEFPLQLTAPPPPTSFPRPIWALTRSLLLLQAPPLRSSPRRPLRRSSSPSAAGVTFSCTGNMPCTHFLAGSPFAIASAAIRRRRRHAAARHFAAATRHRPSLLPRHSRKPPMSHGRAEPAQHRTEPPPPLATTEPLPPPAVGHRDRPSPPSLGQ